MGDELQVDKEDLQLDGEVLLLYEDVLLLHGEVLLFLLGFTLGKPLGGFCQGAYSKGKCYLSGH